jgi:hypothetical protein
VIELMIRDIGDAIAAVLENSSPLLLLLIGLVAIAKGIAMNATAEIFGRASQGLLILVALVFVVYGLKEPERFTLANWEQRGSEMWTNLMNLTVQGMLGYYIVMFVAIFVVFGIKSLVRR